MLSGTVGSPTYAQGDDTNAEEVETLEEISSDEQLEDGLELADGEEEYTLGELEQMLLAYFDEQGLELEVGSAEFVEYLMLQQLESTDEELLKHPQYELLDYYMGEYVYQLDQMQVFYEPEEVGTEVSEQMSKVTLGELAEDVALLQREEAEFEEELEEMWLLEDMNPIVQATSKGGYNRTKAANYANKHGAKPNYNFGVYPKNCTNFVSQAVNAGGLSEKKPKSVKRGITQTTAHWYNDNYHDCGVSANSCYMRDKLSTSWIRVTDFYTYWTKTRKMRAQTSSNVNTIIKNAAVGDVIQIQNSSGRWFHSVIVNRKANGTVYVSSNTANYSNKNIKDRIKGQKFKSYRVINFK